MAKNKGIKVPEDAIQGFIAVRNNGGVSMFNVESVWKSMKSLNYHQGCYWLIDKERKCIDRNKFSALVKSIQCI